MNEEQSKQTEQHAVALFYDGDTTPVVSQNQLGEAAQFLIDAALEAGIPIYENPALIEQLAHLSEGDEIPVELYRLIAEILAFAFYIQGKAPKGYQEDQSD